MEQTKPRILVIDDEKGLRDMLAYTLSQRGYIVATAESGKDAVAQAWREEFDLAICDLMMPDMEGLETLRILKEIHPCIQVVVVTGYATLETAVASIKLGAYDYLAKPYELNELCNILQNALESDNLGQNLSAASLQMARLY